MKNFFKIMARLTMSIIAFTSIYLFFKNEPESFSGLEQMIILSLLMTCISYAYLKIDKLPIAKLEKVDKMNGLKFEEYVERLYSKLGYKAYKTQASGDFGADVIAEKGNEKIAIQCKRYSGNVGIEAVQQVIGSIAYYNATKGMVITNSGYTDAAKELAKVNNIELIDRNGLQGLIGKCQ